jgi:gamma-glutamylcyclotransferase (GGCT)/AIG2-like uncharacterized protein YtfP
MQHLFVYGTLRRDLPYSRFDLLSRDARFLERARVQGTLLDLGRYPGLVPSTGPDDWVHGEVYTLAVPRATLARLDAYEGCGPVDPEPHEFTRVATRAILNSGRPQTVWAYMYRGPTAGKPRVASGDYASEPRS